MDAPAKGAAKGRRYGFACLMCRRRKIRCDGKKPNCANCTKAREICSYKESPSFSASQLHRVHQLRKRVRNLETSLRELVDLRSEDRDRRLREIVRDIGHFNEESSPDWMKGSSQYANESDREPDIDEHCGESPEFTVGEHGTVGLQHFSSSFRLSFL